MNLPIPTASLQSRPSGQGQIPGCAIAHRGLAVVMLALALAATGCSTTSSRSSTVTLKATGDPGVTVRVRSTAPDVPEQVATVPAELYFTGASFDLRCIHGPQPGRLSLSAHCAGLSISTGDTTQPGQVTVFKVRPGEISVGFQPAEK